VKESAGNHHKAVVAAFTGLFRGMLKDRKGQESAQKQGTCEITLTGNTCETRRY